MQVDYHAKYLKYKQKYLDLKEEMMGSGKTHISFAEMEEYQRSRKGLDLGCDKVWPIHVGKNEVITQKEACDGKNPKSINLEGINPTEKDDVKAALSAACKCKN